MSGITPRSVTMVPKAVGVLVLLLVLALASGQPASAINIVNGDCNIIVQNVQIGSGTLQIPEAGCNRTRPEDSFRVRYFWLDSLSLSFLMAGYADENLKQIAGRSPQMWRGGIWPVLREVLDRFGERPGPDSELLYPGYTARVLSREGAAEDYTYRYFKDIPDPVRRNLRIYNAFHPIIWPDIEAIHQFWDTDEWPRDFAMSYGSNPDNDSYNLEQIESRAERAGGTIGYCTFLYDFVGRKEYDSYMQSMRTLRDLVAKKKIGPVMEPVEAAEFGHNRSGAFVSYDAMRYFGAQNWPSDFLVKYGRYTTNDCAGIAGFGVTVLPRELFVLVAVVEATADNLKLKGFGYDVDTQTKLRDDIAPNDPQLETFSFPALNRGDTVVVPLRIELRYDLGSQPFAHIRPNSSSERFYRAIGDYGGQVVLNDGTLTPPRVEKPASAFRAPTFSDVARTYYFGEARDLRQVVIGDNAYEVRETPRVAMLSVAGYDGASCPFLEFVEDDGLPSLHGRVLVGASARNRARTDRVPVPPGARSVVISEREPEVSYLSEIALVDDRSGERRVLAEDLVLKPLEKVELEIPEDLAARPLTVAITGYYLPITRDVVAELAR
jgi:hypothetical protein